MMLLRARDNNIQSFAYIWLYKGNQNEFLKHPKIKWLDGGLRKFENKMGSRSDFLYRARCTQNFECFVNSCVTLCYKKKLDLYTAVIVLQNQVSIMNSEE